MILLQNLPQPLKWNKHYKSKAISAIKIGTIVNRMFRVRVNKIESIRDIDGNLGKRIELIEDREISQFVVRPRTEEAKVVQDVVKAFQQTMPMFPSKDRLTIPKIILFLTEQEYESMFINFDVNQIYEIHLENHIIKFKKIN